MSQIDLALTELKGLLQKEETFHADEATIIAISDALGVPYWYQEDQTPECCSRQMTFIRQVNEDDLSDKKPPGAELWFHDYTAFYIFVCSKCLTAKVVGQQL